MNERQILQEEEIKKIVIEFCETPRTKEELLAKLITADQRTIIGVVIDLFFSKELVVSNDLVISAVLPQKNSA